MTRDDCLALDQQDPLAYTQERFSVPDDTIYLDGNSLGVMPKGAPARVLEMVEREWGQGLIRSWNAEGWFDKPRSLGDRLAPLIGAGSGEVVVCDSTSINIFKVVVAALRLRPGKRLILSDQDSFPTDLYMIEGAMSFFEDYESRLVDMSSASGLKLALSDDVAVVVLSHVDYRTGLLHDMESITAQVHAAGALMIWDLAHSAGALPVQLEACGADFAVGCTYKYLNGGPGAPAFVYAAKKHHERAIQPLSGWHGHANPFGFETRYEPAQGISRFICSTPPLLSYAGLEAGLDAWDGVDLQHIREKSMRMTSLFIDLVRERCSVWPVEISSPENSQLRGSQVSLRHPNSYAVMQRLIERNVVGDFRAPDLMRFGFTPLYLKYTDVWDAVEVLRETLADGSWQGSRYSQRALVT
ncbi:kynureninase [Glutamicibacter sp.]|uniref:kynureninase n=1 Tax=Glutamicibacter sp. TaxID=1931995 RepID=UPI002B45E2E9|nr:kynureninase [Glutamicibacter sp.]HJX78125.1 kynureninase [Glutamicibacter sp.]